MTIRGKIKDEVKMAIQKEHLNIMANYHVELIIKDEVKVLMTHKCLYKFHDILLMKVDEAI